MKQKLFAFGLSVLLLLVPNTFIFAQSNSRSNDELIALLDNPEAVFVVNVRKTLTETAPMLLNKDASLISKLAKTMRSVENETGFNPFFLEKVVFGLKFDKGGDDMQIVFQSDSSSKLAENFYQIQLDNAKLAGETNPLKEKIAAAQILIENQKIGSDYEQSIPAINSTLDEQLKATSALQTKLDSLTISKADEPFILPLKTSAAKIRETLETIQTNFKTAIVQPDYSKQIVSLENQANAITLTDNERAAKINELEKQITKIDSDSNKFLYHLSELNALFNERLGELDKAAALTNALDALEKLPAVKLRREQTLRLIQKNLADMQKNLFSLKEDMKPEKLPAMPPNFPFKDVNEIKTVIYPVLTAVSRKDETFDGKKMLTIKTIKKYGGDREDASVETALLLIDERTLLMGSRSAFSESNSSKTADRNRAMRDLIAKSPDALVAFGVDLKKVDLAHFSKIFGEQKTAWQIFGALTSGGSDLTLDATVEKTARPLELTVKNAEADKSKPADLLIVGNNDVVTDLLDLVIKSVVGIEGKISLRFDKKKATALLENSTERLLKRNSIKLNSTAKTR